MNKWTESLDGNKNEDNKIGENKMTGDVPMEFDFSEDEDDKLFFMGCRQKIEGFIKIPFVVLLFGLTVLFGVMSRVTLHIMIWHINPPSVNSSSKTATMANQLTYRPESCDRSWIAGCADETKYLQEQWFWALFLVMVVPCLFPIVSSLRKFCREVPMNAETPSGNQPTSSTISLNILCNIIFEFVDAVSVFIMVYEVLPMYDPATASVIYLSIGTICILFNILDKGLTCHATCGINPNAANGENVVQDMTKPNDESPSVKNSYNSIDTSGNLSNTAEGMSDNCMSKLRRRISYLRLKATANAQQIYLIVAITGFLLRVIGTIMIFIYDFGNCFILFMFVIGIRYVPNFFSNRCECLRNDNIPQNIRHGTTLFVNIMKPMIYIIGMCVIAASRCPSASFSCVQALFGNGVSNYSSMNGIVKLGEDPFCSDNVPFVIAVINILSSFLFYKCARTACAVNVQIIGFSVPTLFIVPLITFAVLIDMLSDRNAIQTTACNVIFNGWSIDTSSSTISGEIIGAFIALYH